MIRKAIAATAIGLAFIAGQAMAQTAVVAPKAAERAAPAKAGAKATVQRAGADKKAANSFQGWEPGLGTFLVVGGVFTVVTWSALDDDEDPVSPK